MCLLPDGTKIHKLTLEANPLAPRKELGGRSFFDVTDGNFSWGDCPKTQKLISKVEDSAQYVAKK